MKYIRTKDGRIIDLEKFINEEKSNPYYTDFEFEEISKDGELKWSAVGSGISNVEQRHRRCQFSTSLNSEIINQADTIEELCDEFVIVNNADKKPYRISVKTYCERFYSTGYKCLDYAIEKFNSLKRFIGTKEKHNIYADCLYQENPNYKFEGCIKGAIWTDKGLIYVAKMNGILPSGEIDWELL